MRKILTVLLSLMLVICCGYSCGANDPADNTPVEKKPDDKKPDPEDSGDPVVNTEFAEQNLKRAIALTDSTVKAFFTGIMQMSRYYNPYYGSRGDNTSVWMYCSSIEAVNAIMHSLRSLKDLGKPELYDDHFARYTTLLAKLYDGTQFYKGTYPAPGLVSFTQTRQWTVYAVDRAASRGGANVTGRANVYDDQMWFIRELIEAYKQTNEQTYLAEAEYLAEYVLDGWDCTLDGNGQEHGGIPWGPGYVSKHSCSNGPFVSPLVWLHELYKGKPDQVTFKRIDASGTRYSVTMNKADYYLHYAKAVYAWQKQNLLMNNFVYYDSYNSPSSGGGYPEYETVGGVQYRKYTPLRDKVGSALSYNSGSMLSGAADLYRATGESGYLTDMQKQTDASFTYFAKLGTKKPGYYTYTVGNVDGFNNWFNGVMMRGWVDVYPYYNGAGTAIQSFQDNLDYAYDNYLYKGFLPHDLLVGWSTKESDNKIGGMFCFTFAAEYALLAKYELEKAKAQ